MKQHISPVRAILGIILGAFALALLVSVFVVEFTIHQTLWILFLILILSGVVRKLWE